MLLKNSSATFIQSLTTLHWQLKAKKIPFPFLFFYPSLLSLLLPDLPMTENLQEYLWKMQKEKMSLDSYQGLASFFLLLKLKNAKRLIYKYT